MIARHRTFAAYGRELGLTDEHILEALVRTMRVAGPACGGRYIGFHHRVEDDPTSARALAEIRAEAARLRSATMS